MSEKDIISKKDENNYLSKKVEQKENYDKEDNKNKKEIIENLKINNDGKNKNEKKKKLLLGKDAQESNNQASNKSTELSNQNKNNILKNEEGNHINFIKLLL